MGKTKSVIIYASSEESAEKKARIEHNVQDDQKLTVKEISKIYAVRIPNPHYGKYK
ncbi:hypothetical protein N8508_00360 [bacterium]|nr:hypothetical protein [bacterium]